MSRLGCFLRDSLLLNLLLLFFYHRCLLLLFCRLFHHGAQLRLLQRVIQALCLLVWLCALMMLVRILCTHICHDFSIDLFYVLFSGCKFLLQSDFFLLQGVLGSFCKLIYEAIDFILHFSLVHGVDHIFTVSVKLRWEYFWHGLRRVGLIHACRLLNELLEWLVTSHGLIKCAQEMLVELLLSILV